MKGRSERRQSGYAACDMPMLCLAQNAHTSINAGQMALGIQSWPFRFGRIIDLLLTSYVYALDMRRQREYAANIIMSEHAFM
jgi:hypothetical protein